MFQKTKNYIKHKKTYIKDLEGRKYAPYFVSVEYVGHNRDSIRALAWRNSGHELKDSGWWDHLEFEFFTLKGVKTFASKCRGRYNADVYVQEARADVDYYETDL